MRQRAPIAGSRPIWRRKVICRNIITGSEVSAALSEVEELVSDVLAPVDIQTKIQLSLILYIKEIWRDLEITLLVPKLCYDCHSGYIHKMDKHYKIIYVIGTDLN